MTPEIIYWFPAGYWILLYVSFYILRYKFMQNYGQIDLSAQMYNEIKVTFLPHVVFSHCYRKNHFVGKVGLFK